MKELTFYNTRSRRVEEFKPINSGEVKLYTCGPTVYNSLHLGNWLAYIRWDILVRTLKLNNYKVRRVINITDVGHLVGDGDEGEDKLEAGAKREGLDAWQVAERYTKDFFAGMEQLNLIHPTYYAKATDYIKEQIALINKLDSKGAVYKIGDGLYFDTSKFKRYADFAKLDLNQQEAGLRVELNPQKRQPWDFALWKFSPRDKQRDMEWDSPWGKGFPGWHLECSAIAIKLLGETIDIHTGGIDHIPVHHTNEIAQSETATGQTFANYWLHNNFLLISDSKISKSLDNGFTLQDLYDKGYLAYDFKMMALQSHYRSEANFSWEVIESASIRFKQLKAFIVLRFQPNSNANPLDKKYFAFQQSRIIDCLNDDMSTPAALAILSETVDQVFENNRGIRPADDLDSFNTFVKFLDDALGLNLSKIPNINNEQRDLIEKRAAARAKADWTESDRIRDLLSKQGIKINDKDYGQTWQWL